MMIRYALIAAAASLAVSCGPGSPEEVRTAAIAKCERQFGQVAPDPSVGNALCTCLTDGLSEQGLEITDMLGGDRSKVESVMRSCGAKHGVEMPGMAGG